MTKREGYLKVMERKMDAWKIALEARVAEAEKAAPKLKAELDAKVAAWKASGAVAFAKLAELRAAAARYGAIRAELDTVWGSMGGVDGRTDATPEKSDAIAAPRKSA